jgi:hypothetical protein
MIYCNILFLYLHSQNLKSYDLINVSVKSGTNEIISIELLIGNS